MSPFFRTHTRFLPSFPADDVGGPDGGKLQPRARQNVIAEMGWFGGQWRAEVRLRFEAKRAHPAAQGDR